MARFITVQELLTAPSPDLRARASAARALRCVSLGDVAVTFESRPTVLATLQTIVSTEGVSDPDALQAELDVYNALLPQAGLSGCVQLEGPHRGALRTRLQALKGFEHHLWLVLGDAVRPAQFFTPISFRQHVRFPLDETDLFLLKDPNVAVRLRSDHPNHRHEVALSDTLRRALVEDLACES